MPQEGTASNNQDIFDVLIVGAGPAGLAAGFSLTKKGGLSVALLEENPAHVGGISRTESQDGFFFDIGGHRFFTKSKEIEDLWREILPEDLLERPRLSRIYYAHKFYSYPLRAAEAFFNLGAVESFLCAFSYIKARLFPVKEPKSFADWVSNAFGERLFRTFFKTYTEKVWGMSCDDLSADWAAQRIKGLNLMVALKAGLLKSLGINGAGGGVKTLTERFLYPRKGPGMLWEAAASKIEARGGKVLLGKRALSLVWDEDRSFWIVTARDGEGNESFYAAKHILSSAPMREAVQSIRPLPDTARLAAGLRYRDFLTVALMLDKAPSFSDNWIYIHDPSVRVGRIQNFSAWSPSMVPDASKGCLGLEYFCFEGDELWKMDDEALIEMAKGELAQLGLVPAETVRGGRVVRQPKAYPIYDDVYRSIVEDVRGEIEGKYPTFQFIGRNGMHRYDNQDHAMMTGLLAAENVVEGRRRYDVWAVNEDAAYHEEVRTEAK